MNEILSFLISIVIILAILFNEIEWAILFIGFKILIKLDMERDSNDN